MSLKAINESYRALLARALRSMVFAHMKKYRRQMMAMLLAGVAAFGGNATIGVGSNDGNATKRVKVYLLQSLK